MLLQSAAMVAKKLLVDDKITGCVKGICKVLNRKTLSGSSLLKHFAFLKIFKFCASSNLLFFFYELVIGPQLTFLKCCYFPVIRLVNFVQMACTVKVKFILSNFFWSLSAKVGTFSKNSRMQKLILLRSRLHSCLVQRNENLAQFTLFTETIIHLVYPPKFYITFVSNFSWVRIHLSDNDQWFGNKNAVMRDAYYLAILILFIDRQIKLHCVKSSLKGCITHIKKCFSHPALSTLLIFHNPDFSRATVYILLRCRFFYSSHAEFYLERW